MADIQFYEEISMEDLKNMFGKSKNIKNNNKILSNFFGNSVMGRILDLLLDNPNLAIFTPDFTEKSDISRKSLYSNMVILTSLGIVIEIDIGKKKFYKWNKDNPQAKHISKLRNILDIDNNVSSK